MARTNLRNRFYWLLLFILVIGGIPSVLLRFSVLGIELPSLFNAIVFGGAIFTGALLLSFAAGAAQKDIPPGPLIAAVALITVLPEYAVDGLLSWKAGQDFTSYGSFPIANMTGANRLLIGLGWPLFLGALWCITWLKTKKHVTSMPLQRYHAKELIVLLVATLYAFGIWFRHELNLADAVFLILLFVFYLWWTMDKTKGEQHFVGPAACIASLAPLRRKIVWLSLFFIGGVAILLAAEPFVESLLHLGESFGVERFVLVQWVAPFASEAPEVLVALIFVAVGQASMGFAVLLSAKVNQWTLLVGTIPVIYSFSTWSFDPLPFDARQTEEIFLTAAQSLFAILLLLRLRFSWLAAVPLLLLFGAQLFFPSTAIRMSFATTYIVLAALIFLRFRKYLPEFWRSASE